MKIDESRKTGKIIDLTTSWNRLDDEMKNKMNKKLRSFNSPTFLAYALIAPAAIYILLIVAWPVVETIRLSFTNSSLAGKIMLVLKIMKKCFQVKSLIK